MTSARQQRKSALALGLALGFAVCGGIFAPAPTDRILVDAHTGLANSGFDPVAYFTDDKPKIGRPDLELRADGTIWRFKNEGNRAAFADHPEVHMPRFGGYDPLAIARGASVPVTPCSGRCPASGFICSIAPTRARLFWPTPAASSSVRRANGQLLRAPWRAEPDSLHVVIDVALAGSPQAMNPGTRNFSGLRPNRS